MGRRDVYPRVFTIYCIRVQMTVSKWTFNSFRPLTRLYGSILRPLYLVRCGSVTLSTVRRQFFALHRNTRRYVFNDEFRPSVHVVRLVRDPSSWRPLHALTDPDGIGSWCLADRILDRRVSRPRSSGFSVTVDVVRRRLRRVPLGQRIRSRTTEVHRRRR